MNDSPTLHAANKPVGGYVLVQAGQLLNAWAAHREAVITLADLRVWLACHELVARRLRAHTGRCTDAYLSELAHLIGVTSASRVRTSVRRLMHAGLLHWSDAGISFPRVSSPTLPMAIPSPTRLVPIPRPLLRHLARGVSRCTLATTFGLLLRCVFYHRGRCSNQGTCKARWVAETFGIDERSVKRTRSHLMSVGWIASTPTTQWRLNRWGGVFRVNLDWCPAIPRSPRLSPPQPCFAPRLSPPESDKHPLREYNHQEPAPREGAGVPESLIRSRPPSLRDIRPEDLRRRDRLLALHVQACCMGLATPGDAGRLQFASLAARARRVATQNEAGLLAWLLRERRWSFITLEDEDRARRWLAEPRRERTTPLGGPTLHVPLPIASVVQAVLDEHVRVERVA